MLPLLCKVFTWGEEISSSTSSSTFGIVELLHLILEKPNTHGIISYRGAFLLWMVEGSSLSRIVDASLAVFIEGFCLSRWEDLLFTEWA